MRRWLLAVTVLLVGCGPSTPYADNPRTQKVSRAEYGERWPLTIAEAELDCVQPAAVILRSGPDIYALNGTAEATRKYKPIEPLLLPNPKPDQAKLGRRASLEPLVDAGLRLCTD